MKQIIKKKIYQLAKKNINFLIGFSGGLDSTVLLHILHKIKEENKLIKIKAIHINHNININSKLWENHCQNICNKLNINLIIKNIFIKNKNNIENQLREKRYKSFLKLCSHNEIILTAHHKNDQCETILLALKRGSGLTGLSGIKEYYKIKNKIIIRPMLNINNIEILQYAKKNNLKWITDSSNLNIRYDRNFLRIIIIPKLINRWPYFLSTITRSSMLCNKYEKLINNIILKKFKKINLYNKFLNIKQLFCLKKEEFFIIIRKWIKINNQKNISFKITNLIYKLIKKKKNIQICLKKIFIKQHLKKIYIINKFEKLKENIFLWNKKKKKFILPNKLGFLYIEQNHLTKKSIRQPKKNEKILIKFNVKNKIKILGKQTQRIKNIWQFFKILPWERKITPIIFYNKSPIICPNLFITEESKISNKNQFWNIKWKKSKIYI